MSAELRWSEQALLSLIELCESSGQAFTMQVAELAVACLWSDDPAARAPGAIPDEAAEHRLFVEGRKLLASYRDAGSPSFGEGLEKTARVVESLVKAGLVLVEGERLYLTSLGRAEVTLYRERKAGHAS